MDTWVTPYYEDDTAKLYLGDCREVMATMEAESFAAIVCDPPYGLEFMGKGWDHGVPGVDFWREAIRVLKPGGHLLAFGGSRTFHRLAVGIEDAGFEIRDCLSWLYGSGFPKSMDVSKAIDKAAGAEREVINEGRAFGAGSRGNRTRVEQGYRPTELHPEGGSAVITAPATPEAEQWTGWGTALKPAWEPIILARKPLTGTVSNNVMTHGTGALNIDAVRITSVEEQGISHGRWPANVVMSHHEECVKLRQRKVKSSSFDSARETSIGGDGIYSGGIERVGKGHADSEGMETVVTFDCHPGCPVRMLDEQTGILAPGMPSAYLDAGVSRFFYASKAATGERSQGLPDGMSNDHPTVKPIEVMEWLVKLITSQGERVLDPFTGSGSTGVAAVNLRFEFVGIDKEAHYLEIARMRIGRALLDKQSSLW